jgi:hypothetical protein
MPAYLGGSPLGLLMVRANSKDGQATFNSQSERGINVQNYNGQTPKSSSTGYGNSLFSGARIVRAWPGISTYRTNDIPGSDEKVDFNPGNEKDPQFKPRKNLHNNDVYDTSVLNIIDNLKGTRAMIKMSDFAYLKDLGVYPNNRLMIARRFLNAVTDNIYRNLSKGKNGGSEINPTAVMISWVPEGDNFLEISFGEKWEDAKGSFKDILDSIGGDISSKLSGLGGSAEGGFGVLPLPGFTEIFQRQFLTKMGIFDPGASNMIPSGNPNLIKEAKRRTTVGYDAAGSGLECSVSIKMECEYEQKFISGLDPTIVWMDILANITRFGTSPSVKYGLSATAGATINNILNNPMGFIKNVISKIKEALLIVKDSIVKEFSDALQKAKDILAARKAEEETSGTPATPEKPKNAEEVAVEAAKSALAQARKVVDIIEGWIGTALKGLAYKYRIEIMGVVSALSGLPSTPWHITIGNPMRPVFCAGDMYMREALSLTLGPTLAFNDLPSSIKASFTLTNARPWGMQEIMAKFNSGYIRSVDVQRTFYETAYNGETDKPEPIGNFPYDYSSSNEDGKLTTDKLGLSPSNLNEAQARFALAKAEADVKMAEERLKIKNEELLVNPYARKDNPLSNGTPYTLDVAKKESLDPKKEPVRETKTVTNTEETKNEIFTPDQNQQKVNDKLNSAIATGQLNSQTQKEKQVTANLTTIASDQEAQRENLEKQRKNAEADAAYLNASKSTIGGAQNKDNKPTFGSPFQFQSKSDLYNNGSGDKNNIDAKEYIQTENIKTS